MIYNYLLHVTCMCTTSLCITLIKTYESLSMKLDVYGFIDCVNTFYFEKNTRDT